jgi:hypothetical protein
VGRVAPEVLDKGRSRYRTPCDLENEGKTMLGTILIVFLILALVGALPRWSHSKNWGYYPTGGLGLVLLIVLVLLILGRI